MDLKKVIIISGEGERGEIKRHNGKATLRAIKMTLTKERHHGDRHASAWYKAGKGYVDNTWINIDNDDMRIISPEEIVK